MTDGFTVLVIDDDSAMRDSSKLMLTRAGWSVTTVARAEEGLLHLRSERPDVVLSDLRMPGMSGLDFVRALQGLPAPPILLLSAFGDVGTAVEAVRAGARGFLEKPCDPKSLLDALTDAATAHRTSERSKVIKERLLGLSDLDRITFGGSQAAAHLRRAIHQIAASDHPVAIEGAPGTEKARVAAAIHDLSARRDAPFTSLTASEILDGGAVADSGTVFIEGIERLPLDRQAHLSSCLPTKARLLSGVPDGSAALLDPQLRWRIAGDVLHIPSLRQRPDDIVDLFLLELVDRLEQADHPVPSLGAEDLALLIAHPWPGNRRELRAVAERFRAGHLHGSSTVASAILGKTEVQPSSSTLREAVAAFERRLIRQALLDHAGRMDDVAHDLGVGRRTLNEKIVKLGLDKAEILQVKGPAKDHD
jgi:DNA-binding NtrC family response regulator